ncbi:MAG: MBL fold metallo-hydrolase [Acidobacteria bacterium]|nr:MBL fold metallo-hydrolase [Acidobacteriota bacterium]
MAGSSGAAQRPPASGVPDAQLLPAFHVQGAVHLVVGPIANSVVHVGEWETLVVDTQPEALASALLATVRSITSKPIRYIVNTHAHPDHTGGNALVSRAGNTIGGNNATGIAGVSDATSRASIVAHENVLTRMSATAAGPNPIPFDAWPTDTFFVDRDEIFVDEAVRILHQPAAHTDGDVMVFFRRSDVIVTGDVFSTVTYPVIDEAAGGTINGVIAALNRILDLAVPAAKQEGGTYVIPGRGRVADEADVVEYRDMVTIIRDRVQDLKSKGMTLAQIQSARPTVDYDPRYATSEWDADRFVASVYNTLPSSRRGSH